MLQGDAKGVTHQRAARQASGTETLPVLYLANSTSTCVPERLRTGWFGRLASTATNLNRAGRAMAYLSWRVNNAAARHAPALSRHASLPDSAAPPGARCRQPRGTYLACRARTTPIACLHRLSPIISAVCFTAMAPLSCYTTLFCTAPLPAAPKPITLSPSTRSITLRLRAPYTATQRTPACAPLRRACLLYFVTLHV